MIRGMGLMTSSNGGLSLRNMMVIFPLLGSITRLQTSNAIFQSNMAYWQIPICSWFRCQFERDFPLPSWVTVGWRIVVYKQVWSILRLWNFAFHSLWQSSFHKPLSHYCSGYWHVEVFFSDLAGRNGRLKRCPFCLRRLPPVAWGMAWLGAWHGLACWACWVAQMTYIHLYVDKIWYLTYVWLCVKQFRHTQE